MRGESCLPELAGEFGAVVHEGFTAGDDREAAGVYGGGSYEFGYCVARVAGSVP